MFIKWERTPHDNYNPCFYNWSHGHTWTLCDHLLLLLICNPVAFTNTSAGLASLLGFYFMPKSSEPFAILPGFSYSFH